MVKATTGDGVQWQSCRAIAGARLQNLVGGKKVGGRERETDSASLPLESVGENMI